MNVVASWTGGRADALRRAFRMTNEAFAEHLGVAVRTVAYWRARPNVGPRPAMQEILDLALARAPEQVRAQFGLLLAEREGETLQLASSRSSVSDDVASLTAWITSSNTSDEAIEHIEQATVILADMHTQVTARRVLTDVLDLHRKTQTLLRSGKQRLRQTRDLIRIDSDLLAHASVLLGDLGQDQAARNYGDAALLGMQEAETSQAKACYALAKTARWQQKYAEAADLALQGLKCSPLSPMSVQLSYYEANSAALLGDGSRAKAALVRAERIADALPCADTGISLWSFPAERQAMLALAVALRTGDTDGALQAAMTADQGWASGDPYIPSTWAQVRIGAAVTHLLKDSLDGAVEQVTPMLAMPAGFRIATVTRWLAELDHRLSSHRYARSPIACSLRQQIRAFNANALPRHAARDVG
jgi:hypothetical protein